MPSDSGILASVEEQSRWLRMPRWLSTARIVFQERSVGGESAAGAGTDFLDLRRDAAGTAAVFDTRWLHRRRCQQGGHLVDPGGAFRTQVDFGASFAGNGIDAGAAFDEPEVERRFGPGGRDAVVKQSDGAAERVNRIADAVIGPGMASGTGDGDVETAAGKGLRRDAVGAGAVEDQESVLMRESAPERQKIAHAGEISFAFFADVGDQHRGIVKGPRGLPDCRERQQRGESRAVIGDARAEQFAVGRGLDVVRRARSEDGIEVSGDGDLRAHRAGALRKDATTLPARSIFASH